MAYDTPSLFESLEADQTQQRVASRRALALADTRVANKMGLFLRGAQSEAEFAERLGLVEEDFNWLINSAADEVGYDSPDKLRESIVASYKEAAGVQFEETPVEEEEQNEHAESSVKQADFLGDNTNPTIPAQAQQGIQPSLAPLQTPFTGPSPQGLEANPAAMAQPSDAQLGAPALPQVPGQDPNAMVQQQEQMGVNPYVGSWKIVGYGEFDDPTGDKWGEPRVQTPGVDRNGMTPDGQPVNPDNYAVCPGCGTGHYDPSGVCPNCGTSAYEAPQQPQQAPQPSAQQGMGGTYAAAKEHVSPDEEGLLPEEGGASVLDALDHSHASWKVIADGNTDLGGPEPKMDKAHQTGDNPKKDVLGDEDKGRWPTKRKDIVEPIIRENREVEGKPNHTLEEIGEKTTEHVDLPAAKPNDTGFYDGGVDKGPHTKTFPNDGQANPVTHEKQ